jgi:hypothetical protein
MKKTALRDTGLGADVIHGRGIEALLAHEVRPGVQQLALGFRVLDRLPGWLF